MTNAPADRLIAPDLVLLLLSAPTRVASASGRIDGITRLEKLLFLAEEEENIGGDVEEAFTFIPYHYGPYSKQIYESVELLESLELVDEERLLNETSAMDEMEEIAAVPYDREGTQRRFVLTEKGKSVAELLERQHAGVVEKLAEVKDKYAGMPLRQLLRYVYSQHPTFATESKIRDRIL